MAPGSGEERGVNSVGASGGGSRGGVVGAIGSVVSLAPGSGRLWPAGWVTGQSVLWARMRGMIDA